MEKIFIKELGGISILALFMEDMNSETVKGLEGWGYQF